MSAYLLRVFLMKNKYRDDDIIDFGDGDEDDFEIMESEDDAEDASDMPQIPKQPKKIKKNKKSKRKDKKKAKDLDIEDSDEDLDIEIPEEEIDIVDPNEGLEEEVPDESDASESEDVALDIDDPDEERRETAYKRRDKEHKKETREKKFDSFKKKIKRKRRILIFLLIVVVLVLLFVNFRGYISSSNVKHMFSNAAAVVHGEDISKIDFTYDTGNQYGIYKNALVVASSDGIRLQHTASSENKFIQSTFSDVHIDVNEKHILAYDYRGHNFCVISGNEMVYSENMPGTIFGARLSSSGGYTVLTEVTGYRSVINAYNEKNKNMYRYYVAKDWIIDAHLAPNNKRMAAIYVDTEGESLIGGVSFFDLSMEEPVARYTVENHMPLEVEYKESNLVSVLFTGGISFFKADGELVGEYLFDNEIPYIADLSQSGYACAVIGSDIDGDDGKLVIVNNSGVLKGEYEIDTPIKKLLTTGSNVIMYTEDNRLLIADLYGTLRRVIELDTNVRDVIIDELDNLYAISIGHAEKIDY